MQSQAECHDAKAAIQSLKVATRGKEMTSVVLMLGEDRPESLDEKEAIDHEERGQVNGLGTMVMLPCINFRVYKPWDHLPRPTSLNSIR